MEEKIDMTRIPEHIAIIMDGNGRWAQRRNQPRTEGHKAGVETVRRITNICGKIGVKYLTLYTFSTENWNRPSNEISTLMGLVISSLEDEIFMKNDARLLVIGDIGRLPSNVQLALKRTINNTKNNKRLTLVVALSYSARWEITKAAQDIACELQQKNVQLNADNIKTYITEETISQHLTTASIPDPDLLIRTGGEVRISNYLLWQIAYTELYFCNTFWPDFSEEDLYKAIANFQSRQRRFGKTGYQIENENK
ncbi:isoprenyl transferase [Prevotella amnii]|jgi:di-trans,poly-cis-decaprenylcistransferase|uniref:Isoprenyl transferase n=2 Tax=Prevotella amnii TaxID=419005 RepID=A0A096D1X5_9BACT|nr:isoprenyl transferase [Prevotella amnii]EFN91771.1 di-trans,poly-cis-decaprenylcistransferase [Prevotella amnii CRIS 21A-A]KGF51519.1 UDP pyrophosphate synthase [Prevotella amnii DNF00058]